MTDPLRVPVDAVRAHAASLRDVAEQVRLSQTAAASTHLDQSAYGLLCQFMPAYFEPGMQDTVDGLTGSVSELERLGQSLQTAAAGYAGADGRSAATLAQPTLKLPL